MTRRHLSAFDRAIVQVDQALRTLVPGSSRPQRPSPAALVSETELADGERRHVAGLMRVNHTGEVCAQALYHGQALTARKPSVQHSMAAAAAEEVDHLAWCEQRLRELDSRPSLLNPVFYGMSFALGAAAGAVGDRWSLGFVAATEDQVCQHLRQHLTELPATDEKSRAVLGQMLTDEAQHATTAIAAGGVKFPRWAKRAMTQLSRAMTATTYRI